MRICRLLSNRRPRQDVLTTPMNFYTHAMDLFPLHDRQVEQIPNLPSTDAVRGFGAHRYGVIAPFVNELLAGCSQRRILDVGGFRSNSVVQSVFPNSAIRSMNLPPRQEYHHRDPHVIYDGINFPILTSSVPVVIAVDVLEHVDPRWRELLIGEMVRVSQRGVVVSGPFDSEKNRAHEEALIARMRKAHLEPKVSILQHRKLGLPSLGFLTEFAKNSGLEYGLFPATDAAADFEGLERQTDARANGATQQQLEDIVSKTQIALAQKRSLTWDDAYRAILVLYKPRHP
jgi:hypothetical protein